MHSKTDPIGPRSSPTTAARIDAHCSTDARLLSMFFRACLRRSSSFGSTRRRLTYTENKLHCRGY